MGAKDWMFVWADGDAAEALRAKPPLDREGARELAGRLYPGHRLTGLGDGNLGERANPGEGEVWVGVFPGLSIACTIDAARDHPAEIALEVSRALPAPHVYVHAMHSVVDWFAYAHVEGGELRRALSLSPEAGIMENVGEPLPYEEPYWAGEHPVDDEYAFRFHPLELAERTMAQLLGFEFEGFVTDVDPFEVPLAGYRLEQ